MSDKSETFTFSPFAAPLPNPFPGEYRIVRLLGQGAFGTVWEGFDIFLGIPVALKTLRLPRTDERAEAALQLMMREAGLMAGIRHPNVVHVRTWRQAEDYHHFLIMDFVRGGSLADQIKLGPLPWTRAVRYAADVGEALRAVHAHRIIHRDVKPANILWDNEADEARLTDFGVSTRLAEPGTVAGSPPYMAPEAFEPEAFTIAPTPAMDVYSLAATLFHLVTGTPPFAANKEGTHREAIRQGLPAGEPRFAGVPEAVEQLIREGLRYNAADRPTLSAFVSALRGSLNQSLADAVVGMTGSQPMVVGPIRLSLSRFDGSVGYQEVATSQHVPAPNRATRDLKRVPPAPKTAHVRTGERVRVQAVLEREGYLTVFNVGPTGNLNLLYPDDAAGATRIPAGKSVDVIEVEFQPPAGKERVFAIWSKNPLSLSANELRGLTDDPNAPVTSAYRATRDMQKVKSSVQNLGPNDWHAVSLELDHKAE